MIKRVVSNDEAGIKYPDTILFLDAMGIHNFIIVETTDGRWRFRENHLTRLLMTAMKPILDLNQLVEMVGKNFRMREWVLFYMEIGYDLDGFEEIFGDLMDHVLGIVRDPESGDELRRGENLLDLHSIDEHIDFFRSKKAV